MKKVLFASTALVAFAGAAAADVTISGSAEMGIVGGDAYDDETQFWTDIDVNFTMSGTTDGGLTFGASIDLDESDGSGEADVDVDESCFITDNDATDGPFTINGERVDFNEVPGFVIDGDNDNAECDIDVDFEVDVRGFSRAFEGTEQGGESIFLSGDFGTITMGDTDGAFDWALSEVAVAAGSINDAETEHAGYNGNSGLDGTYDGQILRYDYSFGDFAAALSAEMDDTGDGDPVYGIGFRYSFDFATGSIAAGLGYQHVDDDNGDDGQVYGFSVVYAADFGLTAALNISQADGDAVEEGTHYGIGIGYETGPFAVGVNYGLFDFEDTDDEAGIGIAATYDLGGGAEIQAGYGITTDGPDDEEDIFSIGAAFSF